MEPSKQIPKLAHKFFKWYCRGDRYEELHGDIEEFFYDRIEEKGLRKAQWLYLMDVLRGCQSYAWKNNNGQFHSKFNHLIMLKNYFKTSLRSMMRNPLSSFINIFGLSMSIGICLVVYAFMDYQYSIDQHHEHKNEVYLVTFYVDKEGETLQYGKSPVMLAETLKLDYPQISKTSRVEDRNVVVKYKNKVFHEEVRYVDPEFLEMFTFPLKWGEPSSLQGLNNIIISAEMSEKYFADVNPIGYDLMLKFGDDIKKTFTITGVAEPFPDAHQISFDFLINFSNFGYTHPEIDFKDWYKLVDATFVQIENPTDVALIHAGMDKYRDLVNSTNNDWEMLSFQFEQLATLFDRSQYISESITYNYDEAGRITLPILGLFMLVLGCFNYINIAIVSASKRLKEIGVRKSIGASKMATVIQFLSENILVTSFALLVGIFLAVSLFLPWFIGISQMRLSLNFGDENLWLFVIALTLITGVISGLYPAFYISKFQTVHIFKGVVKFGQKNLLTKVFLCVQLMLASILIISAVTFTQNTDFQTTRDWGYDQHNVLYLKLPDVSAFPEFKDLLAQNPNILSLAGSAHHLGHQVDYDIIQTPERRYEVRLMSVEPEYFETMKLRLLEGTTFNAHYESDKRMVLVNESFINNLNITDAVGHTFKVDSIKYEITGVIQDFHIYSFYDKIRPTYFTLADTDKLSYISMRVKPGSSYDTYNALREEWATFFPETPFLGGHQADVWGADYYEMEANQGDFVRAVALIAVLLATMGFYGLVTLNVSGRVREFSIRKVLGAGLKNIAGIITKQYLALLMVAILIGIPTGFFLVESLLNLLYEYPMPMNHSIWLLSVVILVSILFLVVLTQVKKLAKSNPVEGLKVE
ncbi:MAG: ABC transporter permease [Reichenbachiella sp.]|uniref:ABC transporter permease n=1 Tax=Reichenbachiella sp. TaxID=2184521 RepID=UPI003265388F